MFPNSHAESTSGRFFHGRYLDSRGSREIRRFGDSAASGGAVRFTVFKVQMKGQSISLDPKFSPNLRLAFFPRASEVRCGLPGTPEMGLWPPEPFAWCRKKKKCKSPSLKTTGAIQKKKVEVTRHKFGLEKPLQGNLEDSRVAFEVRAPSMVVLLWFPLKKSTKRYFQSHKHASAHKHAGLVHSLHESTTKKGGVRRGDFSSTTYPEMFLGG